MRFWQLAVLFVLCNIAASACGIGTIYFMVLFNSAWLGGAVAMSGAIGFFMVGYATLQLMEEHV